MSTSYTSSKNTTTKADRIRHLLTHRPDLSVTDIAEFVGIARTAVYQYRKQLFAVKNTKNEKQRATPNIVSPTPVEVTKAVEDEVNSPAHYKTGGIETIDFIEAKNLNYNLGNVVKYITRADHKNNRVQDLQKAMWYLKREIGNTAQ